MDTPTDSKRMLNFHDAAFRLKKVVNKTPLQLNANLSRRFECKVYLKREDLQIVRSYNMMSMLPPEKNQERRGLRQRRQSCAGFCLELQKA